MFRRRIVSFLVEGVVRIRLIVMHVRSVEHLERILDRFFNLLKPFRWIYHSQLRRRGTRHERVFAHRGDANRAQRKERGRNGEECVFAARRGRLSIERFIFLDRGE